jgi:hypothetical protein
MGRIIVAPFSRKLFVALINMAIAVAMIDTLIKAWKAVLSLQDLAVR